MARSRASTSTRGRDERDEIVAWYVDLLDHTLPPTDLAWDPVQIGPTWQWDNGWLLPDLTLGWDVLAWCGQWLVDRKGQPWQFTAEQARFLLWFYAVDGEGDWLNHSAVLQRLKGWGKDPVLACMSAAGILGPVTFDHFDGDRPIGRDEPNAWVQVVAVSLEQTKNTMKLFPGLFSLEARQHYRVQIGKEAVWALGDTRQIQAVTSSVLAIEGGRPTLIGRNETQNWNASNQGHDMAGAIEGNAAKSEDGAARMLDICNAYRPGEDSVAQRAREAWEKADGGRAHHFGVMYDSLEAPPEAPLTLEAAPSVVEAIRGDSVWLSVKRIVSSIANPANPPSESRRKWYNQIVAAEDALVDPADWDSAPDVSAPDDKLKPGEKIVAFFDGSKSDDATFLACCRVSDGAVFQIDVWQRPTGLAPKQTWIVDRADVDLTVSAMFEQYKVLAFFADPSDTRDDDGERFWEPLIDAWHRRYKDRLQLWAVPGKDRAHAVAWDMRSPQHQEQFVGAVERFMTDVASGDVPHARQAALTNHVKNARRRPNKYGVGVGKEHRESARKVDGAVCAIGARMLWRLVLNKGTEDKRSGKVW